MINQIHIRANVVCRRTTKKYVSQMHVIVYEEDGVPLYPPQTFGCARCSLSAPCPGCVSHVINEVYRALPLPSRSSLDIEPPETIIESEAVV